MVKRILKDIKVDAKSSGEAVITISIWSDVAYLDKNFVNMLLEEKKEDVDVSKEEDILRNIRKSMDKISENYDQELTPDMNEHDMFTATVSKAIAEDITRCCLGAVKPTISTLLEQLQTGKAPQSDMHVHVTDIIKLIDLMKSHLAYMPTLQERDKIMFKILDDLKTYAILGDKFLKLENFTNFWKLREAIEPTNSYSVGIKSRTQLPH